MNPFPAIVTEFKVTGAVPVEVSVNVCVMGVFTFTLPKVRLELLTLSVGTDAPSCSAKVWAVLFALAVSVTVCAALTEEAAAVKPALVDPAGTVTEAGTVTALLLLAKFTTNPPVAAAVFSVAVQPSVPAPVIEPLVQLSAVSPLEPFEDDDPLDEAAIGATQADRIGSKQKSRATETALIQPFPRRLAPLNLRAPQKLS